MISRRNIRVKVMQLLFMMDAAKGETAIKNPVNELQKSFDKTKELFVYLLYCLTEVARYAEKDALKKSSKHLPTDEDKNINIKISGNQLLWEILENPDFIKAIETTKPVHLVNQDLIKRIYNTLAASNKYQLYVLAESRDSKTEKEIMRFIFSNVMLPDEIFTSHLEEFFTNWDDDCEMMEQLVHNYISKPGGYNPNIIISEDKWSFARSLLITAYNKKDHLLSIIEPRLQNWDTDRIASLDMVLMQMGLCEFLYFETIPTKVTINEYIDLAKEYSTDQSGFFVNAILDSVNKEYSAADKLNKISYKKVNQ